MTVGARITAATSLLLALTLGAYVLVDLRSASGERYDRLERSTVEKAKFLRVALESKGVKAVMRNAAALSADLSKISDEWTVRILPASMLEIRPNAKNRPRWERLRTIVEVRLPEITVEEDDHLIYAIPLTYPKLDDPDGFAIAGALEIERPTRRVVAATQADMRRSLLLMGVIIGFTVLAIGILLRQVITRPIRKLIAGIDDVAKGDLSHVVLAERDDEIGNLATRFTEMTGSLRESRGEAARQSNARLGLEQRLATTEKLATMGQIAAEIAHEVGTPLNVIAGRARALERKAGDREAIEKNSRIIAEQTARITRIIQRLLDITRRTVGTTEASDVNINDIALTTMELLENKFSSKSIKGTLDRAEGLPRVRGEADRLQQVLLNLVLNAIQAMPDGGRLRVNTYQVERRRPGLEHAPPQPCVVIEVSDTGVGIPPEKRDKIFEPFYTSKDGEGGTGLGLAVSHGIVKEHDGWIEIDDPPSGRGTVFRVFLPARR